MVILENEARSQRFQGILWFGTELNPSLTILEGQQGDKPINIQGYDLLMHEGKFAAYGDKRLLRYQIDTINSTNKLLFSSLFPMGAEGLLVRWLVKKTGDMVPTRESFVWPALSNEIQPLLLAGVMLRTIFFDLRIRVTSYSENRRKSLRVRLLKAATSAR